MRVSICQMTFTSDKLLSPTACRTARLPSEDGKVQIRSVVMVCGLKCKQGSADKGKHIVLSLQTE